MNTRGYLILAENGGDPSFFSAVTSSPIEARDAEAALKRALRDPALAHFKDQTLAVIPERHFRLFKHGDPL